jgi:hypothetical protein
LVAVFEADEEDIADVCAVDVFAAEEASAGAGGVERGDLSVCEGGDGVFAGCAGGEDGGEDGDFLHAVFIVWLGCVLELEEDVWRGEEHIVLRPVMMAPGWKFTGLPGMVGAAVA